MKEISEKQGTLERLKPEYMKLVEEESSLTSDIRISEQMCKELYAKQGYREKFKTKEERDRYLKKEINFLEHQKSETGDQIKIIEDSMTEDKNEHERLHTYLMVYFYLKSIQIPLVLSN